MDAKMIFEWVFFSCISVLGVALTAGLVYVLLYVALGNLPDMIESFNRARRALNERY